MHRHGVKLKEREICRERIEDKTFKVQHRTKINDFSQLKKTDISMDNCADSEGKRDINSMGLNKLSTELELSQVGNMPTKNTKIRTS